MTYPSSKGFTLVELLIVLVLIGLSSAIILPSMWQQFDQVKYRSEVAKVKSMIEFCRHYSYFKSQTLTVKLRDNQLIVSSQHSGDVLRTIPFETITFIPHTLHFDKRGAISKMSLTLVKNKQETRVELNV